MYKSAIKWAALRLIKYSVSLTVLIVLSLHQVFLPVWRVKLSHTASIISGSITIYDYGYAACMLDHLHLKIMVLLHAASKFTNFGHLFPINSKRHEMQTRHCDILKLIRDITKGTCNLPSHPCKEF